MSSRKSAKTASAALTVKDGHLRPVARVRHQARVRQSRLDRTAVPQRLARRLGAAEAHRQLEDLQRVQEFEYGSLAANDVERERGARAGALPREQTAGRKPNDCAAGIDAATKPRGRYPALTYFRQLCASWKPSTSRAFLFDSGASYSPSSRVIGTLGQ